MKRILVLIALLFVCLGASAQTGTIQNQCFLGATPSKTQGLHSTNYMDGLIPSCTVTVYLTGTQTLATIYADGVNTPLSNPFTANALPAVNPAGWIFWAATNQGYDVVMSGGIPPNTYLQPVTLKDVFPGAAGGGGGPPTVVEVNGVPIVPSSPANFVNTASVTWSFTGDQILANAASAGSGCQGTITGDNTSTNCGFQNRVNDTAAIPANVSSYGWEGLASNFGQQVVAIGSSPGTNNSTGDAVLIGDNPQGFAGISGGLDIISIGDNTLVGNTAAFDIVAIGDQAGFNNGYGAAVLIGSSPGDDASPFGGTGGDFIAIGDGAGSHSTLTGDQISIGDASGQNTTGAMNNGADYIAIGDGAGSDNNGTIAVPNDVVAIGSGAGAASMSTSGESEVVSIGSGTAYNNQGSDIVAIGDGSLTARIAGPAKGLQTGNDLVAIGDGALQANLSGSDIVAIGRGAGSIGVSGASIGNANVSGSHNTWVGPLSGPNTTSQLSNTNAFGYQAQNTVSNQTVIGNSSITSLIIFGTGNGCLSSTAGVITGSGSPCGAGGGGASNVTVNGGSTLTTANFNGTTPAAGANFINATWQASAPSVSVEVPYATSSTFGVVKPDNSTITISGGVLSSTVSSVAFSAVTAGTNTNALLVGTGGSLGTSGSGSIAATTAAALATAGTFCPSGQYSTGVDVHGNAICTALPTQPASQYIAPQAMSGCGVEYVSGLQYTIGACTYSINGVIYNSPLSNITLSAADPTNPRIDVIFVDTTQVVQKLTGTPGVTPQQPVVDPSTQLELTFVLVPAASSTPGNTTLVDIYLEGVEWVGATGGTNASRVNLTSTNNPYSGTHDVEFGNGGTVTTTTYAGFSVPSSGTVNLSNYNSLVFYMRNKAAWATTRSITAQWFIGATPEGTPVVISNGAFGWDALVNTTSYQQISIPTSLFGIAGINVTSVRFTVTGTGAVLTGFYLDQITLQGGSGGVVLPTTLMNFKGPYSATATYSPNDTVTSNGFGFVALSANTNQPLTNTAVWSPVGGGALGANQVLGAVSAGMPAGLGMPSCSGSANALTWITGSGFGCNTITGGGGGTLAISTNGVSNTLQTALNFVNPSTFNGLAFAFSNPIGGNETFGVTGTLGNAGLANSSITLGSTNVALGATVTGAAGFNSATSSALAVTPTKCTSPQFAQGIAANGNAVCATPAGSGNVNTSGTTTTGFYALFNGTTTITNGHLDDGVTTVSTVTSTEPVAINSPGPSQVALTYNSTPVVPGSSTTAVFGVNASGQGVMSEAGAAAARVCDSTNGVCAGAGAVTAVTGSAPIVSSGGTTPAISCPTCVTAIPLTVNFSFNSGATATDAAPRILAARAGTVTHCYLLTTASDGSTDLTIDIKQNGSTSLLGGAQTITHGTSPGTITTITNSTTLASNDIISATITSGTSSWIFSVQCK